jgi:hypothetical protein
MAEHAVRRCASRPWSLCSQDRTSICWSQACSGRHRRLSLCSLPVPKQTGRSLWRLALHRSVGNGRIWQPARCVILFFSRSRRFMLRCCFVLLPAQTLGPRDRPRASTPPSSALRRAWRDWHALSASLSHRPGPIRDSFRSKLGGVNQYTLDVFVALFGDGRSQHLVC